jgi:hypothetical protein
MRGMADEVAVLLWQSARAIRGAFGEVAKGVEAKKGR